MLAEYPLPVGGRGRRRVMMPCDMPAPCAHCGHTASWQARNLTISWCDTCGLSLCWLDGIRLDRHAHCQLCGMGVGPMHAAQQLDSNGLCPNCALDMAAGRVHGTVIILMREA
jgi:hypothetical protein